MTAASPAKVEEKEDEGGKPMTFWEHLEELRKRLVYAMGALICGCAVAWGFKERIFEIVTKPFVAAWQAQHIAGAPMLHFASPAAAFTGYVKLAVIGGAALSSPVVFYELWAFIAPGLYAREKRYVVPFVFLSSLLFAGGIYFGFRMAFPVAFQSLLGFAGKVGDAPISITPTVMMGEYIDFVTWLSLGYGLVSEIPLVITFLAMAGVVNYKQLIRVARWAVLVAFVAAAVITPPDVMSMMILAVPMCGLYLVSIPLAFVFGKREKSEGDAPPKKKRKKKKASA